MAKKAATSDLHLPPFTHDVEQLLEFDNVPSQVQERYASFLTGDNKRLDTAVRHASLTLSRLYIASLQYPGEHPYEPGEQTMIALVAGRSIIDDPLPVREAAERFTMRYDRFDETNAAYVRMFAAGIHKLRTRMEHSSRLQADARKRLDHVFSLPKVGRPAWYE